MKKFFNKNTGITLVALIIILLILFIGVGCGVIFYEKVKDKTENIHNELLNSTTNNNEEEFNIIEFEKGSGGLLNQDTYMFDIDEIDEFRIKSRGITENITYETERDSEILLPIFEGSLYYLYENDVITIDNLESETEVSLTTKDMSLGCIAKKDYTVTMDGANKKLQIETKKEEDIVSTYKVLVQGQNSLMFIKVSGQTNGNIESQITNNSVEFTGLKNIKVEVGFNEVVECTKSFDINYNDKGAIFISNDNDKLDIHLKTK